MSSNATDDSVPMDLERDSWILPALKALQGTSSGSEHIIGCSRMEFRKIWDKAVRSAGLGALNNPGAPVLHQLRHGGPSADRASRVRSLREVQKRGRWGSERPVQRYEKAGRVSEQMNRLSQAVRTRAGNCLARLPEIIRGNLSPAALHFNSLSLLYL